MSVAEPVIPRSRWPRVLVVEDEPRLRALLLEELPELGFLASGARSAEEADRIMRAEPVDIVLLDLNLPGQSGLDWFSEMRAAYPRVQLIVLTGFGTLDDAQAAIRMDVVDFLKKPFHLSDIEASLERARQRWLELTGISPLASPPTPMANLTLAEMERDAIERALVRHNGNRTAAAIELGISRRTLHNKLREYREQC